MSAKTPHNISICEYGDVSQKCENLGEVYNNHIYDITSDEFGKSVFRFFDQYLRVNDLIGRSVLISEKNEKISCGIIARSAGIFENFKKICACDGVELWNEREVPLTGPGRRLNGNP